MRINRSKILLILTLLTVGCGLLAASGRFAVPVDGDGYLVQLDHEKMPSLVKSGDLPAYLAANQGRIRFVEKDARYSASLTPTDTYLSKQWYLSKIYAREAWNIRHDAPNVVVAVLDSGVDIDHEDLRNNIWHNAAETAGNRADDDRNGFNDDISGWNFVDNNNDPRPNFNGDYNSDVLHGTIVAGIIGAEGNNQAGVSGIAWRVKLMPLKVLADNGSGRSSDVIRAIDYAITNHANIINLSFVGSEYSQGLYEAIRRAHDAGIIIVAAAGNNMLKTSEYSLDKKPLYPICMDGAWGENLVVGVAATDAIDQRAPFSGYGRNCIDISAPGISVFSTVAKSAGAMLGGEVLDKDYDGYWSGTSVAAPMVAGTLALIKATNPSLNKQEVVDVLYRNAVSIDNANPQYKGLLGRGRLNVEAALIDAKLRSANRENNLVIGTATGSSDVRIFTTSGQLVGQFRAFDAKFKGGINISSGDVDGDRRQDIVIVPAGKGGPQVKIFGTNGRLKHAFMAYETSFRGGLQVHAADLDSDGRAEIVVAPNSGRISEIRVFNYKGKLLHKFLAYAAAYKDGVNLTAYDIDNDELQEIVTAPAGKGGPQVKFFKADGQLVRDFWPLDRRYRGGLRLAVGDFSGRAFDKEPSLAVMHYQNGQVLHVYNRQLKLTNRWSIPDLKGALASLTIADFNRDGLGEFAVSGQFRSVSVVRLYDLNGRSLINFAPFSSKYRHNSSLGFINQ